MAEADKVPSGRRNALWSIVERALGASISIISSPLIVHGLGEKRYGILTIGMTTLGFLAFLDLGITAAAVREIAHARGAGDTGAAQRALSTALAIYVWLALFAGGTVMLAAPWLASDVFTIAPADIDDATFVLRMAGLGLGLNLILAPMTAVPRALQRFDISTSISMALTLSVTIGMIVAARMGSLRGAVLVQIASTLTAITAYALASRRLVPELSFLPRIDRTSVRVLASFAVFQLIGQVFGTLSSYSDRLILAANLPPTEVTWYHVPVGLSQKVYILIAAASAFVFPRVAQLAAQHDDEGIAQLYNQGLRLTMLGGVLVGVPLIVGGPAFLRDWMGADFAGHAASTLVLTTSAYVLYCASIMPVLTLLGLGRARAAAMVSILIGGCNIVLALLLTPTWGRMGAASALCLSMGLALGPALWVNRDIRAPLQPLLVDTARLVIVGAAAAAVTFGALQVLPANLFGTLAGLALGALVGLGLHLAAPMAPAADRELVRLRLRRG